MFAGGVADKFGNIYEALWAVRQLLDVFRGRKASIHLEGISQDFKGFEFSVDEGSYRSWHQTKINAQGQNWTIRALEREGVLAAFRARLSTNDLDRCVFVSQSPAVELSELSGKAMYAQDFNDFKTALPATSQERFDNFCRTLVVPPEIGFDWLRRCEFRTIPQDEIKAFVQDLSALTFANEKTSVYPVLRAYLEERLNRELTTETVRSEVPEVTELRIRDWSLMPSLRSKLREETAFYLETFTPIGTTGYIFNRDLIEDAMAQLTDPSGPGVVMVSGVAGSGKSGVVRGLLQKFADRDIPHLAFRVDQHLECKTSTAFGKELLGADDSPVTIMKGLFPDQNSVLVIDQLDAISEISGRNGASKNAILRMIDEARRFGTVRVVLVCRTFDMENDERFKLLKSSSGFSQIEIPALNWEVDVIPLLEILEIDASRLDTTQKKLLCLPLNLAIFTQIADTGDTQFSNRNDLFKLLVAKKERSIAENRASAGWSLMAPLTRLSQWMSSRQRLDAPDSVLDEFGRSVDILASEHLISRNRTSVSFFHESFFDFVFARSFAAGDQSLLELLKSAEQHLFRRTQIRQILENLRESDPSRYFYELSEVLNSPDVRFHVKMAIVKWLAALATPSEGEMEIVLALDLSEERFPILVRNAIQGSVGWFDILHGAGWLARQMNSRDDRRRALLWWLESIAGERPRQLAELLDTWWNGDAARGAELMDWFPHVRRVKADKALVDLCTRVMASQRPKLFAKDSLRGELLIATWVSGESVEGSSAILKAYFDAWFDVHDKEHPFVRDEIRDIDIHSLSEFRKKSAVGFLEGTIDALNRTFSRIKEKNGSDSLDYTFHYRMVGESGIGSDRFLQLFRSALLQIAKEDVNRAQSILDRINPSEHEAAAHLHLEAIAANPGGLHDRLLPLLSLPSLLRAGWEGAQWKSFADAVRNVLPFLSRSERSEIEAFILADWPEIDLAKDFAQGPERSTGITNKERKWALYYLSQSGLEQYSILRAIGVDRLGPRAKTRLLGLARKFPDDELREPIQTRVTSVRSPIAPAKAKYMSDDNWLGAMEEHKDEDRAGARDFAVGGARQLAQVLQSVAKEKPARAADLLVKVPHHANPTYINSLLQGLLEADHVDLAIMRDALLFAHGRANRPHGKVLCHAIINHPELCDADGLWEALIWYIRNGQAPEGQGVSESFAKQELVSIEHLVDRGGESLHISGINTVRGWALQALTQVLWHVSMRRREAWELLEGRVAEEQNLSVRCCLVGPLLPMFNEDSSRSALLLERLLNSNADAADAMYPLLTRDAMVLFPHVIVQVPDTGRALLARMAASQDERTRLVAAWHIMRLGYHDQAYVDWADSLERADPNARRLGTDLAVEAIAEATLRDRAITKVLRYFDNEDGEVRKKSAQVFRNIPRDQISLFKEFAPAFLNSRAFSEDSFAFLNYLEEAHGDVAEMVVRVAEKILKDVGASAGKGENHDMELHQINELIQSEYANSEYNPALRKRLLDVIDRMLLLELRGVEEIVKRHER